MMLYTVTCQAIGSATRVRRLFVAFRYGSKVIDGSRMSLLGNSRPKKSQLCYTDGKEGKQDQRLTFAVPPHGINAPFTPANAMWHICTYVLRGSSCPQDRWKTSLRPERRPFSLGSGDGMSNMDVHVHQVACKETRTELKAYDEVSSTSNDPKSFGKVDGAILRKLLRT
ncbi:hypothetical protein DAEQUDRAFT_346360 [Daedalea quercina L-15889]|uniref:Uncharacterized protein n=1 Tax=Daedalea quercina L-15889 TaxID=1314783 RepID=A0A165PC73_9APHY|nr:hypothetical protein DAEQUDRAFT_346360 [Daedalea quercina L-15889]